MSAPLPPLVLVVDLSTWLGEPIEDGADSSRAGAVLAAASALVRSYTGRTWVGDTGALESVPDAVATVVVQCAARGYTNPEGWRDESTDDWAGRGRILPEAGLFLTASERTVLAEYKPVTPRGLGIVATTRMPETDTTTWVPVDGGGPDFPWY